eukprot:1488724-Pleurochrysis_carterae.AAC.3
MVVAGGRAALGRAGRRLCVCWRGVERGESAGTGFGAVQGGGLRFWRRRRRGLSLERTARHWRGTIVCGGV